MGDESPTANNIHNSVQALNEFDEKYIKESLREYSHILYEYLMIKDKNDKKEIKCIRKN